MKWEVVAFGLDHILIPCYPGIGKEVVGMWDSRKQEQARLKISAVREAEAAGTLKAVRISF